MLRTLIYYALFGLWFASCTKDRVCTCEVTKTGTATTTAAITFSVPLLGNVPLVDTSFTTPVYESQSVERTLIKVTRRAAKNNCISYTEPYNDNVINTVPNFQLTSNSKGILTYECSLE